MVAPPEEPQRVGHDQPDEADHPGHRDARRHQERGDDEGGPLHTLHSRSQVQRRLLAHGQQIERPGECEKDGDGGEEVRGQEQRGRPGCRGQAAHHPEDRGAERLDVGEVQNQ